MARTTLSNSAGPGSSTPLAPQTIKVRDAVIAKCDDQSLDEMNEFVKGLLDRETDELKRLGILAARVYILRQRIMALMESGALKSNDKQLDFIDPAPAVADDNLDDFSDLDSDVKDTNWMRVRIIENCEVNGVRFPSGVVIDVHADDAAKLIEFEKAELQATDVNDKPLPEMIASAADLSDIPDDLIDISDELTDISEDMLKESDDTLDATDGLPDASDDMMDISGELDGEAENPLDTPTDDIIAENDIMPEDIPNEIDLTAPLFEDNNDENEVSPSDDIADNEAIAAAVADKMPKASASSPDGEPVETTEEDLLAGLQELTDLDEIEAGSDDSKKDS
ncbi:hypothetical protein [Candidatus Puniceispirillum marinum]|uniref:AAA ATPase containing von Willebrand factor type A (VWA) domain-like protein n=1 Tax=Puniceispirillum marinum (strain IMCC1322) TaxID=488538 RepID=D5BS49_PUNMI|nr:hypothetical protein [Candidatus Puniceispirillum marinum]ADE39096.1 AAA ATPase containing von Willebrand factor type A (vWA) domain-like protein [Candidatus Puniceispirillum marinum IMCC1322]